jgi:hypothetical protein
MATASCANSAGLSKPRRMSVAAAGEINAPIGRQPDHRAPLKEKPIEISGKVASHRQADRAHLPALRRRRYAKVKVDIMILDLDSCEIGSTCADIAIIGAGAVGLVLGVTLARRGIDVVLCECGSQSLEVASQDLNRAVLSGRPHLGISEGRARVLGGTTTLWGGQLLISYYYT